MTRTYTKGNYNRPLGAGSRGTYAVGHNVAAKRLYEAYASNAIRHGRVFEITLDEFIFLTSLPCTYCGAQPARVWRPVRTTSEYTYNGLDRIDNAVGYVTSNCAPACKQCNYAKGKLTSAEFIEWLQRAAKHSVLER